MKTLSIPSLVLAVVTGLTAPFYLKAEAASGPEYAIALSSGRSDVNPITTAACAGASKDEDDEDGEEGWSGRDHDSHDKIEGILKSLRTALKPLFDLYGIKKIGGDDDDHKGSNLRALLRDVRFTVKKGLVTVTNRASGAVIFTGPLRHLSEGTFYPENMPAGPGGGVTCTEFTYTAFGACQSNNTQTRTVLASSPTGCTGGSPVLTQACIYVPPVTCTLATAVASCSTCHGSPAPASHTSRSLACATCHGPVSNGSGTPSAGMGAVLSGANCNLSYPVSGTHDNGTVNFGAAQ